MKRFGNFESSFPQGNHRGGCSGKMPHLGQACTLPCAKVPDGTPEWLSSLT